MNRSRQEYYEDEYQPQYYHQAGAPFGVEGMPYPNAAAHVYHQQMAQMNMAHGHGMQHYGQGDVRYYDQKQQNAYNDAGQQEYYEQSETSYDVTTSHTRERRQDGGRRHGRMKDARDVERFSGLYDEGMEPNSSATRTETERTGRFQTSSSSRSSSYTSETSSSESGGLGEGIVSVLNDMAGNLKNIRCTNQGQEMKAKDLQMKLPIPMEGFREVMDALSPKSCAQNYNYDNLDSHVMMGMEEQFFGNIPENVMPVYKSLFQSQSESSDESDESESRYEDPRFAAQRQQQQLLEQQAQYEMAAGIQDRTPVPMQIVISNQPSGISSAGSWKLMSPRDRPPLSLPTSPVHDGFIPSYKKTLQVDPEVKQKQMQSKSATPRDKNIPHVIDLDEVDVVECYSDLTNGVRKKVQKDKSTSSVPAIKTHFSGDEEAVDQSKASFQRNSAKKEAKLERERRLDGEREMTKKIEEQREKARLQQEERQRELEEEQRQREAEAALAAKKALQKKKLEEKVEAELQAARASLQAKKLEVETKRREAEERAAKQRSLEEKRLAEELKKMEEERRLREAEERAQLELKRIEAEERARQIALGAKRLEEERKLREAEEKRERELKRIEALEKAEQLALEAKRLEEERLRREAKERAAIEAQKAKELEIERKRIEAETRAAQEKLEALYAQKLDKERRQREEERRERERREQERKARRLKEMRDRVEAEAKAEEEAKREKMRMKLSAERKRREAEKKATEDAQKARKLEKERKQSRRVHSDEQSRASLYEVRGFDDYCKSVASGNRQDIDLSDDDTESYSSDLADMDGQSQNEDSTVGFSSSDDYSQSNDSYSSDDGSNMFTDNDLEITERLRNSNDFDRQFSGARSVNTARSSKSFTSSKPPLSRPPLSKPPLKPTKFTSNESIPITATMSTFQTTFDQGTVVSGHHSLGRFIKSSDESVVSTYSHQSVISAKPVALPVNTLPREPKKKSKPVPIGRSSIVGTIMSFTLKLSLRVLFTVILFLYTWFKHFVVKAITGKKEAKLDCTPSKHALQPGKSVMSEEIQGGAMDDRQNRYLGYDAHNKGDHYSTTMIIKPPSYMADDNDEVGTCVESIVPDTHYPTMSNGKMSSWKITQKNTDASSVSSRSFGVLMKNTYSAISKRREAEKPNWLDHATIDDEMSYYE